MIMFKNRTISKASQRRITINLKIINKLTIQNKKNKQIDCLAKIHKRDKPRNGQMCSKRREGLREEALGAFL